MSILDDILKTPFEGTDVEPANIEEIFAQMFTECADCQQEWNDHLQWCVDHEKKASFHWAIVCCDKHAKLVRSQLTGKEPVEERLLIDILDNIAYVEARMASGLEWLHRWQFKTAEEKEAKADDYDRVEQTMTKFSLVHCQLLNEYYRRNAAFIPYGIE